MAKKDDGISVEARYSVGESVYVDIRNFPFGERKVDLGYNSGVVKDRGKEIGHLMIRELGENAPYFTIEFVCDSVVDFRSADGRGISWETINGVNSRAQERLRKAQKIFDYIMERIREFPAAREHLDGFKEYCRTYSEDELKGGEEVHKRLEDERKEAERDLKGTPDPLEELVRIAEEEISVH